MTGKHSNSKLVAILAGLIGFIVFYSFYSKPPCRARISYANNQLNKDIDLDSLYQAVDSTELIAIKAEWDTFDYRSDSFFVKLEYPYLQGRPLRVIEHYFAGKKHYGAIIFPKGYQEHLSYPVLVWANGLNQRQPKVEINQSTIQNLVKDLEEYFVIIPSFRGQSLVLGNHSYCSDGFFGDAFDGAAEDALRLLQLTLRECLGSDPARITAGGLSRGGNVALLMGVRDTSIQKVFSIAGPTDFHSKRVYYRYGKQYKYQFLSTSTSMKALRRKMLQSSPVYFIEHYPHPILLIQGKNDRVVPLSNAMAIIKKLENRPNFTSILTEDGHEFYNWTAVVEWIKNEDSE